MKLLTSIATVSFYTALSRVFGFFRDVLVASYLGAGPVADAFFVAFKLPNLFRRLFAEGAFNASFVPVFSGIYASRGLAEATRVAEQVLAVMLVTLILFVALVETTLPWLLYGLAPGFRETPERFHMALEFSRITFPYLLFISISALLGGVLNSLHRFAASAAAPIFLNISMIISLVFFASFFKTPGHAMAWGIVGAGVLQCLWLYSMTLGSGVTLRVVRPELTPDVRHILKLMGPGALGAGFMQINIFIDIILGSFLPTGAISFLFYADRLNQLPLSLIGVAISTVLLPVLSKHFKTNHINAALETQNRCVEFGLLLVLPSTLGLFILADPLMAVLFKRGAFQSFESHETALTLQAFVCGLPAYVLIKVFSSSLFTQKDTKTPLKMAMIAVGINFFMNLILMKPFQHVGLAASTALSAWMNAALLFYTLLNRKAFAPDARLKQFFPRVIVCCLFMGLLTYSLKIKCLPWIQGTVWERFSSLSLMVAGGVCIFMTTAIFLKALDLKALKANL